MSFPASSSAFVLAMLNNPSLFFVVRCATAWPYSVLETPDFPGDARHVELGRDGVVGFWVLHFSEEKSGCFSFHGEAVPSRAFFSSFLSLASSLCSSASPRRFFCFCLACPSFRSEVGMRLNRPYILDLPCEDAERSSLRSSSRRPGRVYCFLHAAIASSFDNLPITVCHRLLESTPRWD